VDSKLVICGSWLRHLPSINHLVCIAWWGVLIRRDTMNRALGGQGVLPRNTVADTILFGFETEANGSARKRNFLPQRSQRSQRNDGEKAGLRATPFGKILSKLGRADLPVRPNFNKNKRSEVL